MEVVRPIRHRVLRAGFPEEAVHVPSDEDPHTWHLAAFDGAQPVAAITLFPEPSPDAPDEPAMRFRFMAVLPEWQRRGAGTLLLRSARDRVRERGVQRLWAHGRDSAIGFYTGLGFSVIGDGYIDRVTGLPHHDIAARVDDIP